MSRLGTGHQFVPAMPGKKIVDRALAGLVSDGLFVGHLEIVDVQQLARPGGFGNAGRPDRPSLHLRERNSSMKNRKRESCTHVGAGTGASYIPFPNEVLTVKPVREPRPPADRGLARKHCRAQRTYRLADDPGATEQPSSQKTAPARPQRSREAIAAKAEPAGSQTTWIAIWFSR
jgi:hypothetical protein